MTAGPLPRLLVMTDRHQLPDGAGLVSTLGRCSEAGLSHVVLRELDLDREQRTRWVAELTALGLAVVTALARSSVHGVRTLPPGKTRRLRGRGRSGSPATIAPRSRRRPAGERDG